MAKTVIFVTGGAGYVGSHCVLELLNNDFDVVVLDNLSNAVAGNNLTDLPPILETVERLTNRKILEFINGDLLDINLLDTIFSKHKFQVVIHFAALKAVGESVKIPLKYYRNNLTGTINLLEVMKKHSVKRIIFSSSCTVYGDPQFLPLTECHPTGANITNPYGRSKYIVEEMMKDIAESEKDWCIILLRYFNPVGAHPSGDIGEDPLGIPHNLMPYISQVAIKKLPYLKVFGSDFETVDGTGVRDYTHIMDLADGHVVSLTQMLEMKWVGVKCFNLGRGKGVSVLELVKAFEKASGENVPYQLVDRRAGDVAITFCDPSKANEVMGWKAKYSVEDMCKDAWRWQSKNPRGFHK